MTVSFPHALDLLMKKVEPLGLTGYGIAMASYTPPFKFIDTDGAQKAPPLSHGRITSWRSEPADFKPEIESVRYFVNVLRHISAIQKQFQISDNDISAIIEGSGKTKQQLNDTAHAIIARIKPDDSDIGGLITTLIDAADVSMPHAYIARQIQSTSGTALNISKDQILEWTQKDSMPSIEQMRGFCKRISNVMLQRGSLALSKEEIDKAVHVAVNAHEKRKLSVITASEGRAFIDDAMAHWNDYPDIGALLTKLAVSNNCNSPKAVAGILAQGGSPFSPTMVTGYMATADGHAKNVARPHYNFIEAIIKQNIFHLDLEKEVPGADKKTRITQREALFAKAGYVEITPRSVTAHDTAVIQKTLTAIQEEHTPHWTDIMLELLNIHLQGNRTNLNAINTSYLDYARSQTPPIMVSETGLSKIFYKLRYPKKEERGFLYDICGLSTEQRDILETSIATGKINAMPDVKKDTPFGNEFSRIMEQLDARGYTATYLSQIEVAPRFKPLESAGETMKHLLSNDVLSKWKKKKGTPNLRSMRYLIAILQHMVNDRTLAEKTHLTQKDVDSIIAVSEFSKEKLNDTAHDVIGRITADESDIQKLLKDIDDAADVSVKNEYIIDMKERPVSFPNRTWLNSCLTQNLLPTPALTRELMERYSTVMAERGSTPFTPDEIDKMVAVAQKAVAKRKEGPDGRHAGWQTRRTRLGSVRSDLPSRA